jgi:capsular polysaccharide biosynthesis protein
MLLVEPTYTATVAVLAPPVPLHSGLQASTPMAGSAGSTAKRRPRDSTMDTETQLVLSNEVLSRLATFPGFRVERRELVERISMRVPPNTRVLTIMVRADSPAAARDGADVLAEAYLTLREEILGGIQQRNRESLQRRQKLLQEELEALPGDPAELTRLTVRTRRQAINREISEVQRQLSALDGTAVQSGEVVRGAGLPPAPDDPGHQVSRTGGAALGLLAGVALALRRDRRPRRLRSTGDVRDSLALPVLAEVTGRRASRLHACRRLRNLVNERRARTLLLTGAPTRDVVELAHGVAAACKEGGMDVAVLEIGTRAAARRAPYRVVAVGADEEERVITAALARARRDTDVVIVTGMPLGEADSVGGAVGCDLTVLAADVEHVLDRELIAGVEALEKVTAAPHGLVLIVPDGSRRRRGPGRPRLRGRRP